MKTLLVLLLCCSLVSCTNKNSLEGLTFSSPAGDTVKWKSLPVTMCVHKEFPEQLRDAAKEAAGLWNSQLGMNVFNLNCLTETEYAPEDSKIKGVYMVKNGFKNLTKQSALAHTEVKHSDDAEFVDADIFINAEYYDWTKVDVDVTTVFFHELGHVLGLKHFFISHNSAMNYYPYVGGYEHKKLGDYELSTIANIYNQKKSKTKAYYRDYFSKKYKEALRKISQLKTKNEDDLYAEAFLNRELGQGEAAKKAITSLLLKEPESVPTLYFNAELIWAEGRLDEAQEEFEKIVALNANHYESLMNLAVIHLQKNEAKTAEKLFEKVLKIHPGHWLACEQLDALRPQKKLKDCVEKWKPEA